jgi:hypothetical protein
MEIRVKKLAVLVLLAGMAACLNNKKPEEGREPAQSVPGAAVGSAVGPSAAGGAPASGNAAGPSATAGAPAASAGSQGAAANVGCAQPSSLVCGEGQVDGCASGLTAVHVCVAKDAKAGPPCAQELALSCPPGQVDACLHSPPQATTHLCVIAPK